MNSFLNELYQNGDGKTVTGVYRSQPFMGVISQVRSTYGGGLNVYVALESPIILADRERDTLVLGGAELFHGSSNVAENLHVYL